MKWLTLWSPLRHPESVSVALRVVAVAILMLVAAACFCQIRKSRQDIISETHRQMMRLDMVFAEQTGRAMEAADLLVDAALEAAQSRSLRPGELDGAAGMLRRRIRTVRQLAAVAVVDAAGHVLVSTETDRFFVPEASVKALLARYRDNPRIGLLISPPFRLAEGEWNALLARPMLDSSGTLAGLALGSISLSYFEEFYRSVELSENGAISLHLRDGTVLARFPHVDRIIGGSFADLPPFKQVLAKAMSGTLLMDSPIDNTTRVMAVRALRAFPLAIMVSVEQNGVLADWRHQALVLVVGALLMAGVVVLLLLSLARRSHQVESLLEAARSANIAAEATKDRLLREIAERERAEGALRQAQRIEAIGQLTGGVAHDFNNLLTVVLGNVDSLQRHQFASDRAVAGRLKAIRSATERGATLTSHLLAFARRQPLLPKAVDLNVTVRGMRALLNSALEARASIHLRLANDLWMAMVDQSQIELVILNLVLNARDAMTEGGVITVETSNHGRAEPAVADAPPAGDYVRVSVRDSGTGMSPEVLARAFEPFFTTKPPGAGSGLGLSQVFGTARQSGGEVVIESVVGQGTTVMVDLPRAKESALLPLKPRRQAPPRGSPATILLVDDDEALRAMIGVLLRELGYRVCEANSGEAALHVLGQRAGIDILLTSMATLGLAEPQLAFVAKSRQPGLLVIFLSGYTNPMDHEAMAGHYFIRKPFGAAELCQVIEAALLDRQDACQEDEVSPAN